ncbi:MAG: C40 family peptidase [bacterium]
MRRSYTLWLAVVVFAGSIHCAGSNPKVRFGEKPQSTAANKGKPQQRLANSEEATSLEFLKLSREIEAYLGVAYRWGGTTRKGMDCSGFVSTVFRNAFGLDLPHSTRMIFREGVPVARRNLIMGDLVFFKQIESRGVSHVGIYVGDDEFVHASTSRGVVISSLTEDYYRKRYVGARRINVF